MKVDRDALGFGCEFNSGVYVGGPARQESLYLENVGRKELIISTVEKTGDTEFSMELPTELSVKPLGHTFIRFFFLPDEAKTYAGAITIKSNAANEPQKTIVLNGCGIAREADGGP